MTASRHKSIHNKASIGPSTFGSSRGASHSEGSSENSIQYLLVLEVFVS